MICRLGHAYAGLSLSGVACDKQKLRAGKAVAHLPCLHIQLSVSVGKGRISILRWIFFPQEFGAKGSFIQYGGVVDHALVVRGITTVFNTDYITDVIFHLNGAIKVAHLTCFLFAHERALIM